MKRALILAAGKGQRLGELTATKPKCLLQLTHENTVLDLLLDTIAKVKIKEIIIISGFANEYLKDYLSKKWASKFVFKIINNPKYSEYNNIYSAYLAKDLWDDKTILFNSDIVFDPEILNLLITKIEDKGTQSYLVIDDHEKLTEEDMKVTLNEKGVITRIHKSLDINTSLGEYIGITYLRGETRLKFLDSLESNVKKGNLDLYYEDALDQIASQISVFPCSTNG
ncbi:MAG: NTP transferase domain-containing protein, partial [Candidatus Melainabacteria bacterium]|nr:NTP transferase domain-containing protein [Candidatus Melainabacteria bacterium]